MGLDALPPAERVRPEGALAFNGDGAAYRVAALTVAYFGLSPTSIGDFDSDGIEDLAQTVHWATVDGMAKAGQVHVYLGRPAGRELNPRRDVPDLIFYGDEAQARLGIEVAPAGDVNRDGYDDLLMSAAFARAHLDDGRTVTDGGKAYLVFGGLLHRFRCPTKIRASDIGTKVPGLVLEGGHDATHLLGWTNTLDSGDFDGDGDGDLVLGAYDPSSPPAYDAFPARAYVIYGSPDLPSRGRFRLGARGSALPQTVIEAPTPDWTMGSTMFETSFVGDLNGDGADELAIGTGRANSGAGSVFIFRGRQGGLPRTVLPVESADARVDGETSAVDNVRIAGLVGARPAGDVDGDGRSDAQLTARYARVDDRRVGAVAILRGRAALPGATGFLSLDGIVVGAGNEVHSIGMPGMNRGADFNGDGYSDILVNDPYFDEDIAGDRQTRGRLWLVRGQPNLPPFRTIQEAADVTFLADTRLPGMFGFQWNTGDWNGDGSPDIVVADHYLGDAQRHDFPGASYLYFNGSAFRVP